MIQSFHTSTAQRRRYAEHMADATTVKNLPPDPPPPEPTEVPTYDRPEPIPGQGQQAKKLSWDIRLLRLSYSTLYLWGFGAIHLWLSGEFSRLGTNRFIFWGLSALYLLTFGRLYNSWFSKASRLLNYYPLARSFGLAIASGPTTKKIAAERVAICGPCSSRATVKGRDYCKQCGCGYHPLSRLKIKARMAWGPCPRNAWARATPWKWWRSNDGEEGDDRAGNSVPHVDLRARNGSAESVSNVEGNEHGS